ncbi:MAG TPA: Rne/Rng family ribonuclease [Stellaceae bacterium]|nr:Rne/Rng family ribonuclease [Stellaceae bacterium]
MAKKMLIDAAHPEETRVVVLSGNRLEEFDFESSTKKQVKGNIYLAKVTRVEPSLQAAFVDYGGNRHGFLAFSEIHPDYYRIPVSDRETGEYDPPEAGGDSPATAVESATPAMDIPVELPDAVSINAPAGGSPDDMPGEVPGEVFDELAGAAEDRRDEAPGDEAPVAIAAALPEAAPVASDREAQPRAAGAAGDVVAMADEAGVDEPSGELPADVSDVEMAAPIESVVSSEPFFESVEPTPAEEIATLDDDEEAEERETERRRSYSSRHYKIQEVVKRRQIMLVQVAKEERGNKGAALTTYLSLAGRYCVLMPNTARGGGVSRKITSISDRRRLKEILEDLDIPEGMGVIVRTAGSERSKAEIKRDYEYLMRLWSEIRELTLQSTAPALIYEEGNLIKRSIRDLYARDIDEVVVEGEEGYKTAKSFMRMLTPSHARRVQSYRDPLVSLFHRYQVESQIDAVHSPIAQLRSGGYIVINQTEALVSIDVNSGRATRERNIEETALRTNLEASDEIARQLRLRDLAGLIVIDFIDMEEHRHNSAVERRLKEALKNDRARIQVGRISAFGLMEMSRQRLRPSLAEASTQPCPHCGGTGFIRSTESTALHVLRAIEEEGARSRTAELCIYVPTGVALYILNQKRESLAQIEARYGLKVIVGRDDALVPPNFRLERLRAFAAGEAPPPRVAAVPPVEVEDDVEEDEEDFVEAPSKRNGEDREAQSGEHRRDRSDDERGGRRRRRRRGRRGEEGRDHRRPESPQEERIAEARTEDGERQQAVAEAEDRGGDHEHGDGEHRGRRRRGRRGGRWRSRDGAENGAEQAPAEELVTAAVEGAEIPPEASGGERPSPFRSYDAGGGEIPSSTGAPEPVAVEEPVVEQLVEAAVESAEIPSVAPAPEPARELETVAVGNGDRAVAEPRPAARPRGAPAVPEGVDLHAVTEKPESPRRGWWTRLIQ